MTRRTAITISTGLLAAASVTPALAANDKAAAKRLHLAILILTLNPTLRAQLKTKDPTTLSPSHILYKIHNQWPALYDQVKANVISVSGFDAAADGFRKIFAITGAQLPIAAAATDLYPDPTICPCNADPTADTCDQVARLLG